MHVRPVKTRIFKEGEDLFAFIRKHVPKIQNGSILVITSKIVALAEGRTAIVENTKTKEKLIRSESEFALPTKWVWLTVKNGFVMPNAGIDESNANGKLILLPKDSFAVAQKIRALILRHYKIKKVGILITDSRTMPLRAGVSAVALGYAGFKGIRDYRGKPDLFGKKFSYSRTNVADTLAAAAIVEMGEGSERQPLALITDAPVEFVARVRRGETKIDIEDDMYRPLFRRT
jgi:coenzyme F420-0:L-glutamate ligase